MSTTGGGILNVMDRTQIEGDVERQLAATLPEVDLLQVTQSGSGDSAMLKVVVDHPDGVDHDLCVQVTQALDQAGMREHFGIEVWSPGPERPLRTIDHFTAAIDERVKIWTGTRKRPHRGHIRDVGDETVVIDLGDRTMTITLADVRRAELAPEQEAA